MGKLAGKVALVTGGGRGIGRHSALAFAAEGAKVVVSDAMEEGGKHVVDEIQRLGGEAIFVRTDVSRAADVEATVAAAEARFGALHVLFNNAGIMPDEDGSVVDTSEETFDKVIAVNVRGVWLGLKYVMKAMSQNGGSIVITSSTSGIRATPHMSAYTASKHAVIGLMRSAAIEGSDRRIRVNTVNPSPIDTPMIVSLENMRGVGGRNDQPFATGTPLGRYGTPEEVAKLMLFLASDDSSFCTGGVYMVDGGVSAGRKG